MTPEQHQQLMYYYAYQQQYQYPYVQPVAYDPTQYAYRRRYRPCRRRPPQNFLSLPIKKKSSTACRIDGVTPTDSHRPLAASVVGH